MYRREKRALNKKGMARNKIFSTKTPNKQTSLLSHTLSLRNLKKSPLQDLAGSSTASASASSPPPTSSAAAASSPTSSATTSSCPLLHLPHIIHDVLPPVVHPCGPSHMNPPSPRPQGGSCREVAFGCDSSPRARPHRS
uniref:Uncharacterized protein n=2 Tax=Oryza sativa subsp. japonica TaxID=39947 RepID=Q5Z5V2_ORYSJ|nr:hypothetical protein [Oryza sativa Japonica Group]